MRKRHFLFLSLLLIGLMAKAQLQEFHIGTNHIALVVSDLEKSAVFYTTVLKLSEIKNETGNPKIRWFAFNDQRELHLLEGNRSEIKLNKSVHLALNTTNFQAFCEFLRQKKYPFENWYGKKSTYNERPDGVLQVYLQDPDGYWIEVNDDQLGN